MKANESWYFRIRSYGRDLSDFAWDFGVVAYQKASRMKPGKGLEFMRRHVKRVIRGKHKYMAATGNQGQTKPIGSYNEGETKNGPRLTTDVQDEREVPQVEQKK